VLPKQHFVQGRWRALANAFIDLPLKILSNALKSKIYEKLTLRKIYVWINDSAHAPREPE